MTLSSVFEWLERSHLRAAALLFVLALALFLPGLKGLPPMDRDEPRFAQATRQMLETRDFVDIRFQTEARHKKPVGIYWMQAAVVDAAERAGIEGARGLIWLYRLPSLLGAILVVLLTYAVGVGLSTRRAAFMAAILMAAVILLGVEARLAKTDAVLSATVVACMGGLARVWMTREDPRARLPWPWFLGFWVAMGVSVLVKGPIAPAIVGLTAATLCVADRSAAWLRRLRPLWGLLIVLVMVAPWMVAITIKTGGTFFEEAVGQDMLGKVAAGQESHGAPPGTYLAAFLGTAWPLAPWVLLAIPFGWRQRWSDPVLFCLAWAIPMWIVFEAVPTKLPHYVLPLYPALAILAALAAEARALAVAGMVPRLVMGLLPALVVALGVAATAGAVRLDGVVPWAGLALFALASVAAVLAWRSYFRSFFGTSAIQAVAASVLVAFGAYWATVPLLRAVAISPRLAEAARAAECAPTGLATVGYREPSLVFLTRTDLEMTDGPGAAGYLRQGACRVAFVEKRQEEAFLKAAGEAGLQPKLLSRVTGLNLNGGRALDIGVYLGP
ncbi:glycosyltransferase family 39 protein [uncultured Alsobacter sp.]|uniref:ArnT family glycosyltransferase n=1 Tax=uncultured Alsobacter sp. TaxID=1748258 RepID=UPI0025EBEA22|nr:glycosyltransferase family 39 protein [uncultured Alsobacter sp.]